MKHLAIAVMCLSTVLVRPATAFATPPTSDAATSTERARLTALYRRAQQHFLAKRYTEALPQFQQVASKLNSPNAWLYVARCQRQLGRPALAHRSMRTTLALATRRAKTEARFADTRDAAMRELQQLDGEVGHLRVRLPERPAALTLVVNGDTVTDPTTAVVVDPGAVIIVASAPQKQPLLRRLTIAAGEHQQLTLRFPASHAPAAPAGPPAPTAEHAPPTAAEAAPPVTDPPAATGPIATDDAGDDAAPSPAKPLPKRTVRQRGGGVRIAGIAVLGVSALSWAAFGVGVVMADQRYQQLQEKCGFRRCTDVAFSQTADEGRILDIVANSALGLAVATTVAGPLMIAFGGPTEEVTETGRLRLSIRDSGVLLGYSGRF